MLWFKQVCLVGLFVTALAVISGCGTMEGAGKDVEAVGEGVQEGSREVRDEFD